MVGQVCEVGQLEELAASGGMIDVFALERPGEVVGDKDGIQSGGEGGVNVGFGAIADHPCDAGFATVMRGETAVGGVMLLRKDFDGAEVRGETGAAQLVGLLGRITLGDEDEAVTGGEVGQSFGYMGQEFDLLIGDGLGEADDAGVFVRCDGTIGELLETGDERVAKAVEPVTASGDSGSFDTIEALADLLGRVDAVVVIGDEGGDGTLEVDVVFPERVVCIDKQCLIGGVTDGLDFAGHRG